MLQPVLSIYHFRRLVGVSVAQSTHAGLGRHYDGFETCVFFHSIFLSHTLSFLRGVVQSVTLKKVPFPSISGKLQRSIIREINGTGPISCLVPFVSAKMLRTSKKMSKFIGIYCACYANVKHIQPLPMHLLTKLKCTQPPHTEYTTR